MGPKSCDWCLYKKGTDRHRKRWLEAQTKGCSWESEDQELEEARKVRLETSEGASPAHSVMWTSGLLT